MTEAMLTPWGETLDREHPLPEYPRPQLRRQSYLNLNGIWEYAITKTPEKPALMQGGIVVPFSPEAPLSGVGHILQPDEYLWYRRTVTLPEGFYPAGRLLLHFGAVDQRCTVWLNGKELGSHTGGYLPFTFELTDCLTDGTFTLELCVTDPTDTGSLSRGKQRLKSNGIWYTPQSGIWQTVWLEAVPQNYLHSLRITPQPEQNTVHLRLDADDPAHADIAVHKDGIIITTGESGTNGEALLSIPAEWLRLWSPEDPYLYDVTITLTGGDTVESYFGMRSFGIGKDEKGLPRLLLNGKPITRKRYDYAQHRRAGTDELIYPTDVLIIEGIHVFYDERLCELMFLKLYMSVEPDICLLRRISRDINERGRSIESISVQYLSTVKPMYDKHIRNYIELADVIVAHGGRNARIVDILAGYVRDELSRRQQD